MSSIRKVNPRQKTCINFMVKLALNFSFSITFSYQIIRAVFQNFKFWFCFKSSLQNNRSMIISDAEKRQFIKCKAWSPEHLHTK